MDPYPAVPLFRITDPDLDPIRTFFRPLNFFKSQIPSLNYKLSYPDCCMFKVKILTDKNIKISRKTVFDKIVRILLQIRVLPPYPDPQHWLEVELALYPLICFNSRTNTYIPIPFLFYNYRTKFSTFCFQTIL